MIIKNKNEPFFHIIVDEIFSHSVLPMVYEEINSLKNEFKSEDMTKPAVDNFGNSLKKNKGVFLAESKNYKNSKIISSINASIKEISKYKNWQNKTFCRMYNSAMWGSELLNCYSSGDYYMPHTDSGLFTMITFLYENHKNGDSHGGDLYFPEYDYLHKCNNNQAIIFFSKELHGATTFTCNKNCKRYSIVTFSQLDNFSDKNHEVRKIKSKNKIDYQ